MSRLDCFRREFMTPDWDSYDADPLTEIAISRAEDVLNLLTLHGIHAVAMALNDGGVQIEMVISREGYME